MLLNTFVRAQVGWAEFRGALRTRLVDIAGSERGGVAAEYALLIALIAVVVVVGAAALGIAINAASPGHRRLCRRSAHLLGRTERAASPAARSPFRTRWERGTGEDGTGKGRHEDDESAVEVQRPVL